MPLSPRRAAIVAIVFTALCLALELNFVGLSGTAYFAKILDRQNAIVNIPVHAAGVAAIVGVQALFIWASLVSGGTWRAAYFLIFAGATVFEYAWFRATGLLTNAHDLDLVFDNRPLWAPMAKQFVNWLALVPVVAYAGLLVGLKAGSGRRDGWRFATVVAATAMVHSVYALSGYVHKAQQVGMTSEQAVPTGTFEAFARSITVYGWNQAAGVFHVHTREPVAFSSSVVPRTHIVFVVDESVTAGHLSVDGYPRETTPWLDQLSRDGVLTNWGVIAAGTTQSSGSVACLLTGVTELPDVDQRIYLQPTLFQYAKAMNYQTHLFDGESSEPRFGVSYADLRFVDDWRTTAFGDDPDTDLRMAAEVARLLTESQGQFIVVLKRGNHFPHARNVPPGRGTWSPAADTRGETPVALAAVNNSYDNALRYNLDAFFQTLLGPSGVPARTTVIYTSDHGESLSGAGANPMNRRLAWDVMGVPLLMFGDHRPTVDTGYRASHRNLFPTLLDLMGVPASARVAAYARSLLAARAADHDPRVVLAGMVTEPSEASTADFDAFERPVIEPPH